MAGAETPQISVNDGPWVTVSSISAGDELQVRLLSSELPTTRRSAVVTIGTLSDTWNVTTRAEQIYVFVTSTI